MKLDADLQISKEFILEAMDISNKYMFEEMLTSTNLSDSEILEIKQKLFDIESREIDRQNKKLVKSIHNS